MFIATRAALSTAPAIASATGADIARIESTVISVVRSVYITFVAVLAGLTVNYFADKSGPMDISMATLVALLAYYKANAAGWIVANVVAPFWRGTATYKNSSGSAGYAAATPVSRPPTPPAA